MGRRYGRRGEGGKGVEGRKPRLRGGVTTTAVAGGVAVGGGFIIESTARARVLAVGGVDVYRGGGEYLGGGIEGSAKSDVSRRLLGTVSLGAGGASLRGADAVTRGAPSSTMAGNVAGAVKGGTGNEGENVPGAVKRGTGNEVAVSVANARVDGALSTGKVG